MAMAPAAGDGRYAKDDGRPVKAAQRAAVRRNAGRPVPFEVACPGAIVLWTAHIGDHMADNPKKDPAGAEFRKAQRAQDGKNALIEYEAEAAATRAKTERLRAQRL